MIERFIILHLTIKEWSIIIRYKNSKEQYGSNEKNNDCTVNGNDTNINNNNVNEEIVDEYNHDECNDEYDDNPDNLSDDELNIPILYYYDNNDSNGNSNNKTTSKINFAGLCKAIYYLPQSILPMLTTTSSSTDTTTKNNVDVTDRTRVVNLNNNNTSLVFIPLQTSTSDNCVSSKNDETKIVDIIAVVQISIPNNNNNTTTNTTRLSTTTTTTSTTKYISQAIQQSYIQFCLLRNGTIHERLLVSKSSSSSSSSSSSLQKNYYYPGMDQLFKYYQHQRRNKRKEQQYDDTTSLLKELLESIPYTKLCNDLFYHFNDFIQEFEQQQQHSSFTTNSILNCFHNVPIYHSTCTSTSTSDHYGDHDLYNNVTNSIDYANTIVTQIHHHLTTYNMNHHHANIPIDLKTTTSKISTTTNKTPYMIGISIFINQQLIIPTTAPQYNTRGGSHIIQYNPNNDNNGTTAICLSNEHVVILYQYMMQIQSQMVMTTQQHVTYPDNNNNSNNNNTVSSNTTTKNTNRNNNKSNIMINHHSKDHSSKTNLLSLSVLRPFALSFLKDDCIVSSPSSSSIIPIIQNTRTTVLPSSSSSSPLKQQQSDIDTTISNVTTKTVPITFKKGTYMSSPPLSLLSVLDDDETNSFLYTYPDSNNEHVVWAPQITIPIITTTTTIQNTVDHTTSETKTVQGRMCLYQRNNIHCLIYLSSIHDWNQSINQLSYEGINDSSNKNNNNNIDSINAELNHDNRIYQSLFHEISNHIDTAIDDVLKESMQETQDKISKNDVIEYDNELLRPNSSSSSSWEIQQSQPLIKNILKPGYDIFVIDRNLHTVFIHIDECNNDGNHKDRFQSSSPERRQQSQHRYSFNNIHNYDVRSLLNKYISSELLVLALDNAIEEVQQYINQRKRINGKYIIDNDTSKVISDKQDQHDTNQDLCTQIDDNENKNQDTIYESCTLLQKHWIYSFVKDNVKDNDVYEKELYILFYTSHYVTLSDVQHMAIQIRNEIL